jgi:hypothetical protein
MQAVLGSNPQIAGKCTHFFVCEYIRSTKEIVNTQQEINLAHASAATVLKKKYVDK